MENQYQSMEEQLSPTPLEEIQKRAGEQVVELPGWGDGKPFYCRLRRLSLLEMARSGKVPNPLMSAVSDLYAKGSIQERDLALAAQVMTFIAQESMAGPTFQELSQAGLQLTDMQLSAIYLYAQRGPESLRPFRAQPGVSEPVQDSADVADTAKRIAGDPRLLHRLLRR